MRKLTALIVLLVLCGAAWAANTPPPGSNGDTGDTIYGSASRCF